MSYIFQKMCSICGFEFVNGRKYWVDQETHTVRCKHCKEEGNNNIKATYIDVDFPEET